MEFITWGNVFGVFVLILFVEYVRRFANRNTQVLAKESPPGPPVWTNFLWPFAFDLTLLKTQITKRCTMGEALLLDVTKEARKYKDGIFRFYLAFRPLVVLYKADTAEVLLNSNTLINKSFDYKLVEPWLGTGLLTSNGAKWKSRRKMLTPTFHFKILDDFLPVFNDQAEIMCSIVLKAVKTDPQASIDIMPLIKNCTLDIICESAMGIKVEAQTKESVYLKAQTIVAEELMNRAMSPWLWPSLLFHISPSGRRFYQNLTVMQEFTLKVIMDRMQDMITRKLKGEELKNKRMAFLDLLLSLQMEDNTLGIDDIREEVDTFMFEGHDTTAMGIAWGLYLIGLHPEVQKKIHDELDSIFGEDRDRLMTNDDIKQMKYLECAIKEAQRLYPSVPLIAREIGEDVKIKNYTIPKGTDVAVFITELHRDPKVFPDPEKFDPERFFPENASGRNPFAYVPFSAGPRNCIGQKFALNEEKVVIGSVLRKLNLKSLKPRDEVRLTLELVSRPLDGLPVRFSPRSE